MHRQTVMVLLHMHSAFPTEKRKQMIVMSFSGVTNVILMHRVGGIEGECAQALRLLSGFWS